MYPQATEFSKITFADNELDLVDKKQNIDYFETEGENSSRLCTLQAGKHYLKNRINLDADYKKFSYKVDLSEFEIDENVIFVVRVFSEELALNALKAFTPPCEGEEFDKTFEICQLKTKHLQSALIKKSNQGKHLRIQQNVYMFRKSNNKEFLEGIVDRISSYVKSFL